MPRFVILRHDPPANGEAVLHWDFMLEAGDHLLTWALEREPTYDAPIAARQLADHRLLYLDYDGTISGGRGTVSRWDVGDFVWKSQQEGELLVDLNGAILQGTAFLTRDSSDDQRWVISFSEVLSADVR